MHAISIRTLHAKKSKRKKNLAGIVNMNEAAVLAEISTSITIRMNGSRTIGEHLTFRHWIQQHMG